MESQYSSHFADEETEYIVVKGTTQGQTALKWRVEIQTQVFDSKKDPSLHS